jgi:hypothetical protein
MKAKKKKATRLTNRRLMVEIMRVQAERIQFLEQILDGGCRILSLSEDELLRLKNNVHRVRWKLQGKLDPLNRQLQQVCAGIEVVGSALAELRRRMSK